MMAEQFDIDDDDFEEDQLFEEEEDLTPEELQDMEEELTPEELQDLEEEQRLEEEERLTPEELQAWEEIQRLKEEKRLVWERIQESKQSRRKFQISTTWFPSVWWLLLWSAYLTGAAISPVYQSPQPNLPIVGLLIILLFMGITFKLERRGNDNWLGLLVMNSMIAMIVVPGCIILNVYREVLKLDSQTWKFEQKLGFFAIQIVAFILTDYHLIQTWRRWKVFLSKDAKFKARTLLQPTVEGPIYFGVFFLIGLFSAGILRLFVNIEPNFPNTPLPLHHLAFLLVIFLLTIGYAITLFIHKRFQHH